MHEGLVERLWNPYSTSMVRNSQNEVNMELKDEKPTKNKNLQSDNWTNTALRKWMLEYWRLTKEENRRMLHQTPENGN